MSLHVAIVRVGEKRPKYFKALFGPDLKRVPSERESGATHFRMFALYCAYMSQSCCSNVGRQFAALVNGFALKRPSEFLSGRSKY